MQLLHADIDISIIAPWLGHTTPPDVTPGCHTPPDAVLAYLESL